MAHLSPRAVMCMVPRLIVLVTVLLLILAVPAAAQTGPDVDAPTLAANVNLLWVVIGAALVVFMQAGFAMVETGFCRAIHAAHVVSTNFAIFGLAFVGFYLVGFGLAFGGYSYPGVFGLDTPAGGPLVAIGDWVLVYQGGFGLSGTASSPAAMAFFLYMVAFMDTTATIPTGAMAERWRWNSFIWWGLFCGALYYPLVAAWTWGGGWLSQLGNTVSLGFGYVDFAGSGVVHLMGAVAGLAGALVLGPRLGKYDADGRPRALLGHNLPMAMLGTFILLFGWFGFNAASTFAATDVQFAVVAANTAIAGAFGSVASLVWVSRRAGSPDPSMMVNGMLGGLVAITAPCAFVAPWAAALIGTVAGVIVVEVVWLVERRLRIDDPVGAIAVHGVCGIIGVISVGLFATGEYGAGWNVTVTDATAGVGVTGLLYDVNLGGAQLAAQVVGAVVIAIVGFGMAYGFFTLQNRLTTGGIRPSEDDELAGLDLAEMGVPAYDPPPVPHVPSPSHPTPGR